MTFGSLRSRLKRSEGALASAPKHPVVIIDDDETILESLAFTLQGQYEVRAFSSAQEGVKAVDDEVCAVILDVKMPGNDGFWACSEIRKKAPDIPVIFHSAYQDLKDPYSIINEHRPFGYICKSDNAQQLIDTLGMAVKLHAMIIQNRKLILTMHRAERARG